jgi:hypothetical protein
MPDKSRDWRINANWKFPYKNGINSPEYKKDKKELFSSNGNGWWVNDGSGWNPDAQTPMQRAREYRKKKGIGERNNEKKNTRER